MDWWIVAVIAIQVGFIAFVIWIGTTSYQKRKQRESEQKLRLLETFESGRDFGEFLSTEQGQSFLSTFESPRRNPKLLWVISLYSGLLALFCGLGFFVLTGLASWDAEDFWLPAVLLTAAGLAMLLAGFLTRPSDES